MRSVHNLMLEEIDNYLNIIFNLRNQIHDQDFKIFMLEFELKLEKELLCQIKTNFFNLSVN